MTVGNKLLPQPAKPVAVAALSLMFVVVGCGKSGDSSKSAQPVQASTVTVTSQVTAQPSVEPDP
ncbi:MAG: hypothetical protein ACOYEV_17900, partial [Candidatus Nanopelagicales bacterium]